MPSTTRSSPTCSSSMAPWIGRTAVCGVAEGNSRASQIVAWGVRLVRVRSAERRWTSERLQRWTDSSAHRRGVDVVRLPGRQWIKSAGVHTENAERYRTTGTASWEKAVGDVNRLSDQVGAGPMTVTEDARSAIRPSSSSTRTVATRRLAPSVSRIAPTASLTAAPAPHVRSVVTAIRTASGAFSLPPEEAEAFRGEQRRRTGK